MMKMLLMEMSCSMATWRCVSLRDWLILTYRCWAGTLVRIRLGVFWMSRVEEGRRKGVRGWAVTVSE